MVIFNEEKIKYEALDMLIQDLYTDIRFASNVNVIVDLKEVFKKVFRPNVFPEKIESPGKLIEEITSDIIGIISHYRNYFYKNGKYSSFYFLYSKEECEALKVLYSNYKKDHYEKYYRTESNITNIKKRVLKAVETLVSVIPNSFFIDCSKFDDVAVVKFLKNNIKENEFTLLLTNDDLWFQALNFQHIFAINCKGIKSKLIRAGNALEYLSKEEKVGISSALLPLILSISGCKKYSLPNIKGIGMQKAIGIVKGLLAEEKIQDTEYLKFPIKKEELNLNNKNQKLLFDNFEELKRNYELISCTDLIYSHENELAALFVSHKPLITANRLMEMNSKFFFNFPINLDMLLRGESLK